MPNQQNVTLLKEIKKDLEGSNGVVLADFKGMTVLELSTLRKKVRKDGGTSKILKNTLLQIALKEIRESNYWLRMLAKAGITPTDKLSAVLDESNQLRAMLSKAVATTKGKAKS